MGEVYVRRAGGTEEAGQGLKPVEHPASL
jgi:hypothetical protein